MFYGGMSSVPGAPGNLMAGLDLPFGGGNRYRQLQKENQPGAPRPTPGVSPTKVFPFNAPGREGAIDVRFRQALGGSPNPIGNVGSLLAQINPTYPAGDPRYGQPMQMGRQPASMNTSEYGWMQGINRLRETNPDAYQKIKGMMGPFGWTNPPAGFQVPPGL